MTRSEVKAKTSGLLLRFVLVTPLFFFPAIVALPMTGWTAVFVNDSFMDIAGTNLTSHTGETGATWTKVTGITGDTFIDSNNAAHGHAGSDSLHYASGTPASADYDVQATFLGEYSDAGIIGIAGRLSTSAKTGYFAYWDHSSHTWRLSLFNGGTETILANDGAATFYADGAPYTIVLKMRGTSIELWRNGSLYLSATDSRVNSAGKAGIYWKNSDWATAPNYNTAGRSLDNFTATDASSGPRTRMPKGNAQ